MSSNSPVLPPSQAESLKSPRTMLGMAIVGLFAATVIMPYIVPVPTGPAANLILTTGETVKTVLVLVMGYYFGTTQGSNQKSDALAHSVAATADLAKTAKTAGEALAAAGTDGSAPGKVTLAPGDEVKVAAEPVKEDVPPDDDPTMYAGPRG